MPPGPQLRKRMTLCFALTAVSVPLCLIATGGSLPRLFGPDPIDAYRDLSKEILQEVGMLRREIQQHKEEGHPSFAPVVQAIKQHAERLHELANPPREPPQPPLPPKPLTGFNDKLEGAEKYLVPHVLNVQQDITFKIEEVLRPRGWAITRGAGEQSSADMVWVKDGGKVDWKAFDGSRQVVNRIQNESCITTKGSLHLALDRFDKRRKEKGFLEFGTADMHPETYALYIPSECKEFFSGQRSGIWILKETHNAQGEGVTVHNNILEDLRRMGKDRCSENQRPSEWYVVQRYLINPLLLGGRKSETRSYWAYASLDPLIVIYHRGTVRLNSMPYKNDSWADPLVHLTNIAQQKAHPQYNEPGFKDTLKWTYEMLDEYLSKEHNTRPGWVQTTLEPRLKDYIRYVVEAARDCLPAVKGSFALYGADFILSSSLHPWLTEIQLYPGMSDSGVKRKIIPAMLEELAAIEMEILAKRQRGLSLKNLESVSRWEVLVNEAK